MARSALTVAVEGLLTPFMAGGVSTLTVESDHDYHPNEDSILLYYTIPSYITILYYTTLHYTMIYYNILYSTLLYSTLL